MKKPSIYQVIAGDFNLDPIPVKGQYNYLYMEIDE